MINFLVIKGLPPTEIFNELKNVLGDSAPSYTTVKKWTFKFKRGRTSPMIRVEYVRNCIDRRNR